MSDKPLAEQFRDNEENDGKFWRHTGESCADALESFAAEHLTEQTEPDQSLLRDIEYMLTDSGYCPSVGTIAEMIRDAVNDTLRRVRELLVGKERP